MFRTRTQLTAAALTTLALALTACLALEAKAQVHSYHHHSTVAGDFLGGAAEVIQAEGLNARNRAYAYRVIVAAEREREALRQERVAAHYYEAELYQQRVQAKADANRRRQQLEAEQLDRDAQYLLEDVQNRSHVWPRALRSGRYAGYRLEIQSILRDWDAGYSRDRRALRLVSEELRTDILRDRSTDHLARREAIQTVRQLEQLASRRDYQPNQRQMGTPGSQLASR